MENIMTIEEPVNCSICNKIFSCKEGLLNHKRNVHKIENLTRRNKTDNCYHCKYCDRSYTILQSRWAHQKKCGEKKSSSTVFAETDNTIMPNNVLEEMQKMKEQIDELQKKLLSGKQLDTKTFKAVNQILMDRSYSNSNNTINHTHNYNLFALGSEELVNVLTFEQKQMILDSRLGSLEKIVEIAHCGEMQQFKNIIITNLKDSYAYRYDEQKGYFVTVTKDDLLDSIVMNRMMDIEAIYDELKSANKIDPKTRRLIQDFLDRMTVENVPFIHGETRYDSFKSFKTSKIKILLYNNQDKITKDIALLINNPNNMVMKTNAPTIANNAPDDTQEQSDEESSQEQHYSDQEGRRR